MESSPPEPSSELERAWCAEARRIYRRYAAEFVETFQLCPWAGPARTQGRSVEWVDLGGRPSSAFFLASIDRFLQDASLEVALFLYPRVRLSRREFEAEVEALHRADIERRADRSSPVVLVVFHPEAALDLSSPSRLVPFLRRSPDPTVQMVRASTVDALRKEGEKTQFISPEALRELREEDLLQAAIGPALHERIAQQNHLRLSAESARAEAVLGAILQDRQQSYGGLESALLTRSA